IPQTMVGRSAACGSRQRIGHTSRRAKCDQFYSRGPPRDRQDEEDVMKRARALAAMLALGCAYPRAHRPPPRGCPAGDPGLSAGAGFSLVETLIALAITLVISSTVFALLDPTSAHFGVQPESSDMQQRLRVGEDTLYTDLLAAGAGPFITDGKSGIGPL